MFRSTIQRMDTTPRDIPEPEPPDLMDPTLIADGPETVAAMVGDAGRKSNATPIRRTFVQPGDRDSRSAGGPLAELVRRKDLRGLVLYLLVITLATKEPWDVRRPSSIWARALDLGSTRSSREAVSKAWRRLCELKLVMTHREKRMAVATLLREDGSGEPYEYPVPDRVEDRYLKLPMAFWLDQWYQRLSLPGIAMLLVLLAEKDDVVLPIDRIPDWYGISRATAQRGLAELQKNDLLDVQDIPRKEPRAPLGYTIERHHRLQGAFARKRPKSTKTATATQQPSPALRRRQRRQQATDVKAIRGEVKT